MRLHYVSDLHCDNWELLGHAQSVPALTVEGDALVLAGDIADGCSEKYLEALSQHYTRQGLPVLMVPGNHDLYYSSLPDGLDKLAQACRNTGIHLLDDDSVEIQGVRIFGGTLWAAFEFPGSNAAAQMNMAKVLIADYKFIRGHQPTAAQALHRKCRAALLQAGELAKKNGEQLVTVFHHAPLFECVPEKYAKDMLSGSYASDLSVELSKSLAKVAIYGHMHGHKVTVSKQVPGLQLLSNARGRLCGATLETSFPECPDFNLKATVDISS